MRNQCLLDACVSCWGVGWSVPLTFPSLEICQVTSTLCVPTVPLCWHWKWAKIWSYLKTALSVALLVLISFHLAAISWEHPVTSTWFFFFFGTRHLVLCKVSCKCQLHPVPWMKQEVTKRSWIVDVKGIALASWLRLFLHHLVLKQFAALMKILCNDASLWLIEPKPMANPISAHPCEIRWISSSERLSPTGRSVG